MLASAVGKNLFAWGMVSVFLLLCSPALAAGPSHAGGSVSDAVSGPAGTGLPDDRYVFQRLGGGRPMQVGLSYEMGYGTRDTRFFGREGIEQGVRGRWNATSFLTLEAYGGMLLAPGHEAKPGGSAMLLARPMRQARFGFDLHLGAGYAYDFRGDHVLRFLLGVGHRFGKVRTAVSSVVEVPLTGERDEADLMFAASAMVPVTGWFAQGFEFGAEDLEGLWDPEESEGGARFLFGPTSLFYPWRGLEIRLNASVVYAYVANQVLSRTPPWGLAARLSLGYRF